MDRAADVSKRMLVDTKGPKAWYRCLDRAADVLKRMLVDNVLLRAPRHGTEVWTEQLISKKGC